MTAQSISITEAARNFSDFVNRVAYRGERFFLVRGKRRVASLTPVGDVCSVLELERAFGDIPRMEATEAAAWLEDLEKIREEAIQ